MSASPTKEDAQLLTTEDVADLLGVKPATLVDWRHELRGPTWVKMNRLVRYRLSDILRWQKQALEVVEPTAL